MVLEWKELGDGIFLIRFTNGQNRMNPAFFKAYNEALGTIEKQNPAGLITIGTGRFFSNGLDVEYLFEHRKESVVNRIFPDHFYPLMKRVILMTCPTVAIVSGHAYAGGMCLAMAHDFRVMLDGGGIKMCMNEISLGSPIPKGIVEILKCKFKCHTELHDALLMPVSFNAKMALEHGIVNRLGKNENELVQAAKEIIEVHKNNCGTSYSLIKTTIYSEAIKELESKEDIPINALFKSLL